jgi:hypothetical protein
MVETIFQILAWGWSHEPVWPFWYSVDRDKIETKRARLQEAILVVQCSEEAVTALETEVVEDKTLTTREVLIDDYHLCFVEGPAAEDGEETVQYCAL